MSLLRSMFEYKAWANEGLYQGLMAQCGKIAKEDEHAAMLILHHNYVVDDIFAANLQGQAHGILTTAPELTPPLEELFSAVRSIDRWYIDYVTDLDVAALREMMDFTFTDGKPGRMSREEMLGHVLGHGAYHRGEVGQLLTRLTGSSPRDTFTGYLHEIRPVHA
ncbi:DinB family protein [Undibacterium sp. TS12]|uniref:DinB family protein n=1 Tax=Undibacterium sp. TS12 TaxID=2908202 RepID=UPI001F4CCB30|nr:DinB family protein [Undibacterium sp. TS12]MCH8617896.1 damage-inducible protein DinB [Undibacterium sp. TS12]